MNTTKTLSFALLTLVLQACNGIEAEDYAVAVELCQPHGGVASVSADYSRTYRWIETTCKDGVEVKKTVKNTR